jgi:hypothetical protein
MPEPLSLEQSFSTFSLIRNSSFLGLLHPENLRSHSFQRHPLGFIHVKLIRQGKFELRLHVWPARVRYEQQPYWPIHNHRFDLLSNILVGAVTNHLYKVVQSDFNAAQQLYRVIYGVNSSELLPTGIPISVELLASNNVEAPHSYAVEAGIFHETCVPKGMFTATLALTRDSDLGVEAKAVGLMERPETHTYDRVPIENAEKEEVIDQISTVVRNAEKLPFSFIS